MENYLIIYDDDDERIGIYDANDNRQRLLLQSGNDDLIENERTYIYALSFGLCVLLICLLFISGICVALLRKTIKSRNDRVHKYDEVATDNDGRRKSVTINSDLSPNQLQAQCIDIHTPERQVNLNSNDANSSPSKSPLQNYLNGNTKSIVYDHVIKPWNMQAELDAI